MRSYVKCKLFGEIGLDESVVRAVRDVFGPVAYVIGDVNCGYRLDTDAQPLARLAITMGRLREAGLSACEDPAELTPDDWADLQQRVAPLDLIPDVLLRPAWSAIERVRAGLAAVCNLHPSCMGSIVDAGRLARRVRANGMRVMVGDDSLIGPACAAWQQLAIGMSASWVEAIEKPDESDAFLKCVRMSPVRRDALGRCVVQDAAAGFGLDVDAERLREVAKAFARC